MPIPMVEQAMSQVSQQEELAEAERLNQQVVQLYQQGKYAEAIPLAEKVLAIRKKVLGDNHLDVANSLHTLGFLYYKQSKYAEAEPLFQKSLAIRKQQLGNHHPNVATSLNNLGLIYSDQGRYTEAEKMFQQSLAIRKQQLGDNHQFVATSLNNLAFLYRRQGRYTEAEPFFQESLAIWKQKLGDNHPSVAISLNNLGLLYSDQGRYIEAKLFFQQSLAIRKQQLGHNHPSVGDSLNNLGLIYYQQERYAEAEPLFQQSLAIDKQQLGENHPSVATGLNNLAALYSKQGKYAEAEPLFQQSLAIFNQQLGDKHPSVAQSLNNLARFYQSQGNTNRAIEWLSQGITVEEYNLSENLVAGDERQKQKYMRKVSSSTNTVISLNLQSAPNNPEATRLALKTIFERKGRILDVLTNSLQILRQRIDDPDSQELLTELIAIRTQQANLIFKKPENFSSPDVYRQLLTEVENKAKKLADQLGRRSAEFRNLSQPITLEAIQKQIPADAALVELVRYKTFGKLRYGAYILYQSGEPQAIDLGEAEAIDKAVEKLRTYLRNRKVPLKQFKREARKLDKLVMQPVRQVLGETKTIILSPDATLNLIPFEALVDDNNQYLVENYQITYLTSGRDLLRQTPNNNRQSPLVMADPFYYTKIVAVNRSIDHISQLFATKNFGRLEGTAEEAKAIKTTMGLSDNQIKTKGQATENALKQVKNPDFIHIATHGFFLEPSSENSTNVDNPLFRSGLVFAGVEKRQSGGDDGVFTANEATLLNLVGTQLVVLSACDTGIGDISAGEGIYGLRRAFVIAGSESQLISLWKVDDTATKDLMVAYYQGLKDRKGRREALSQIQRDWLEGKNG
ncbi:MAG: tetratricopeptide repeat protein, partial [Moorea sp. SIO2I5]|nr:tetratricopeptide repeat protein [Moorena sp. SIO2I5]